ncbi:MAG: class B sortase [Ruminococcaceae bacterium]|nr:class B sortase [Oscillospiraceae bacterium]
MEQNPQKKKLAKKIAYYILLGFFCLVFIASAIYVADYLIRSNAARSEYDSLLDQYNPPSRPPITEATEPTDGTAPSESTEPTDPPGPTEPTILEELQVFYDKNQELVGWITVPDTKISYPVLQSPTRPDYYLDHTFEGKKSAWGAIYVREACDVFKPSDNITLYGHHMKDGSMFSGLDGYKRKSFWESHQYIYFDTLYERHVYQVIVAFKTSGTYGNGYAYHLFDDAKDEADFNQFINNVKALAYYDTGITAQYGDKLITLSTCEYTIYENGEAVGRHVVIAKRIA